MAAEWLLLPAVQALIGKVTDALIQQVTSIWGVDDDRHELADKLVYVRSLLADAERKAGEKTEAGLAVKRWMRRLRAAAYRAENVLDDFRYEALRRDAEGGGDTSRKQVPYLSGVFDELRHKVRLHHKGSTDLAAVLAEINKLVDEMNTFGLDKIPEPQPQDVYGGPRQTHSALGDPTGIFGRDADKNKVVELLLQLQLQEGDHKDVQVLPIIGMGGLGKTTLAKMVYNDSKVEGYFELRMWHCVSENFEPTTIVKSLIEWATKEPCGLSDNIEVLRGKLQQVIGRKRCLLVLDDVWNEDRQKWEDCLKPLLCSSAGGSGSMILVTSRSRKVASIMGTLPPHELQGLSSHHSWELFSTKAFSQGVEMQADFVAIGKRIVEKCKGLPLALSAMGGLMSLIHQLQEWKTIAESNIGDTSSGKDEILPTLKLSYRHLPPEMKRCFAFCAIFPKDFVMEKDKLIQLWLANGFIREEGTMELLVQRAESVFNELAWRSFLEDVKVRRFHDFSRGSYEAVGCKMHDLVHDLAKDVTDECAFAAELNQRKASIKDVHHMKVSSDELGKENISGLLKEASSLRTLLIDEADPDYRQSQLQEIQLQEIQITDSPSLLEIPMLPSSLERMTSASCGSLVALPSNLGNLAKLRDLSLLYCGGLKALPDGMDGLTSLEWVRIVDCPEIKKFPPGLLQRLPTLKFLYVSGCPELQRRCREGGEYFDLVSSIPEIDVEAE